MAERFESPAQLDLASELLAGRSRGIRAGHALRSCGGGEELHWVSYIRFHSSGGADGTERQIELRLCSADPRLEPLRPGTFRNDVRPRHGYLLRLPRRLGRQLGEIRCPTLIVVGEHDARTPVAMSEDLNKAITTSFLKIVPNCGHFYSYEQPERVCEVMTTFLEAFGAGRTERVGAR